MSTGADFQNVLAHLAAIVESAHDAVIGESVDSLITSWNQGAEHLFGFSSEEVIGESTAKLIPADRAREEGDILQRIARGDRIDHFDTVRKHKDGPLIDVSLTISPIRDASGRVVGLVLELRSVPLGRFL